MGDVAPVLRVENLRTYFRIEDRTLKAVDDVSFTVEAGKVLCIVGESGSGKSVTAKSILRLIDPPGHIVDGAVYYRDQELLSMSERDMERVRGDRISMVFQNPMTSLNPAFSIGDQVAESILIHQNVSRQEARDRAIELLSLVGIPDASGRYGDYPHQFSGGMRQRILIASAIACRPDVLIADEPTTALDVTIQAQILRLLKELQEELENALVMITHDLGVVAAIADDVIVMYAGRVVEHGSVHALFHNPQHPYTRGLLQAVVGLDDDLDKPLAPIAGSPMTPIDPEPGCRFRARCSHRFGPCSTIDPRLVSIGAGHSVACHLAAPCDEDALRRS